MDLLDMGQTLGRGAYGKVFKGRLKLGSDLRVEVSTKSYMKSRRKKNLSMARTNPK